MASDLDERALELARLGQLLVGLRQLPVGRLQLGDQPLPFGEQLKLLGPLAEDPFELSGIPGFEDVAEDVAFVDGVDHRLDVGVPREEHSDCVGLEPSGMAQELITRHAGHALVGEDQVDLLMAEDLQPLGTTAGRQDTKRPMEQMAQALEHIHFVVHDQQGVSPLIHPLISGANSASNRPGRDPTSGSRRGGPPLRDPGTT